MLAPPRGFEPRTLFLTGICSTVELQGKSNLSQIVFLDNFSVAFLLLKLPFLFSIPLYISLFNFRQTYLCNYFKSACVMQSHPFIQILSLTDIYFVVIAIVNSINNIHTSMLTGIPLYLRLRQLADGNTGEKGQIRMLKV